MRLSDDITQEVFRKGTAKRRWLSRRSRRFSTWLYQITMNTVKAYFRKREESLQRCLQGPSDQVWRATDGHPDQSGDVTRSLNSQVEQALAQLSPKLRAAIVLTAIEHLSAKEAATIECLLCTATMHWRIHQARKRLKQLLHRYLKP